jgi:hypothetical protein
MALYLAGRMAQQGLSVALFDWELAGDDHRDRLERLFGPKMPKVAYARCERPLAFEVDRLRRIVHESAIEFSIFDSVAFACDGPPEAAEVAGRYFRAVRQIGGGSLHIAHVAKGEGADKKPFGSIFWHNGARATWFSKLAEDSPEDNVLHLGLFNRKCNLGRIEPALGYRIVFDDLCTTFFREEPSDSPDLAKQLTARQRMYAMLKKGALTTEAIAEELKVEPVTVRSTVSRHKKLFMRLPDGRIGLVA